MADAHIESGAEVVRAPEPRDGYGTLARELEALRRSEGVLRDFVETSSISLHWVGEDGTILWANQAELDLLGYLREEYVGRNIADFHADPPVIDKILACLRRGETLRDFPARLKRRDGSIRDVLISSSALFENGEFVHSRCFTRDVTALKREQETSALLAAIVDSSDDAIVSKDLTGRVTSWNAAAERMFGYNADEMIGRSILTIIPADRQDEEPQILERLKRGERIDHFETMRRRKDGSLLHVSLTISPVRDARGQIIGASKIARDITQRKRAEQASAQLSAIVESSGDAIYIYDLNGTILTWNRAAEELYGYTAQEIVGSNAAVIMPPGISAQVHDVISPRIRRGETIQNFETERRRRDGTVFPALLTISPIRGASGGPTAISVIARDITDRKQAESELRESEQRFRHLADAMPQIVWAADAQGNIEYYNQRCFEFTGVDQVADVNWAALLHPEDAERVPAAWLAAVREKRPYEEEFRLWDRRNCCWKWFIARALPIPDDSGAVSKWFGSTTEIDNQKQVESALRQANFDLEQFAYSATHDLKEPLRTIKIYSELLSGRYRSKLDGDALNFLDFLSSGATRIEQLVDDLLAYTRVTTLDGPIELADAQEALANALSDLEAAIKETAATVTNDPLPAVRAHRAHLQQVFQNLVSNAMKYRNPELPPVVHISARREAGQWVFSVSDNGIGIQPEYTQTIFRLFKRLHSSEQYSGTGIGLSICQRIVERYHGRIWVESVPGKGSTFRFTLPV